MAAPAGNKYWKLRSKHGREKLFSTPQLMWDAACEYFEWCENNPLHETKAFSFQGIITTTKLPIMRATTLSQLCFYLNCNEAYFRQFKSKLSESDKDFSTVINDIEQVIYNQKFQGAAGNLLNANIIARDLGLNEKTDITTNGKDINQTQVIVSRPENIDTINKLLGSE